MMKMSCGTSMTMNQSLRLALVPLVVVATIFHRHQLASSAETFENKRTTFQNKTKTTYRPHILFVVMDDLVSSVSDEERFLLLQHQRRRRPPPLLSLPREGIFFPHVSTNKGSGSPKNRTHFTVASELSPSGFVSWWSRPPPLYLVLIGIA